MQKKSSSFLLWLKSQGWKSAWLGDSHLLRKIAVRNGWGKKLLPLRQTSHLIASACTLALSCSSSVAPWARDSNLGSNLAERRTIQFACRWWTSEAVLRLRQGGLISSLWYSLTWASEKNTRRWHNYPPSFAAEQQLYSLKFTTL